MKSHNKSWLQIAEYASLASSAAGTVIAIASQLVSNFKEIEGNCSL